MRGILSTLVLAASISFVCFSAHSRAGSPTTQHVYLIEYKPGPAWQPGLPMNKQALGPHAAYWKRLAAEARAIAAGPYRDIDGGMAIFSASSLDDAREVVAADPAVTSKVFTADLHEWSPLIRGEGDLPRVAR